MTIVVKTKEGMIWRKPWAPLRKITDKPEAISLVNPSIKMLVMRAIQQGDLIKTDEEPVIDDPRRLPLQRNFVEDIKKELIK